MASEKAKALLDSVLDLVARNDSGEASIAALASIDAALDEARDEGYSKGMAETIQAYDHAEQQQVANRKAQEDRIAAQNRPTNE